MVEIKIVEREDKYYRVEFWIDGWKFHSAKMPLKQAETLLHQFVVEEKKWV